jgi:DNA polymerase (family 10)
MLQMRDAAAARGLAYLAITDHSQSAVYAHGLAAATLSAQKKEARALSDGSCTVLCGVESDILKDGALDYADEVLRALDVVVASVHARFGQKGPDLTARMVAAARHPCTDIVGHPTGRLLLGRAPSEYDVDAFFDACAHSGCALEMNANPARLDLNEKHLAQAKALGIPISIAADAHAVHELDYLEYGVSIARRAGLTPDDVLNARPLVDVKAWIGARRQKAHG